MLEFIVDVKDNKRIHNLLTKCSVVHISNEGKRLFIKGEEGLDVLLRYDPNVLKVNVHHTFSLVK